MEINQSKRIIENIGISTKGMSQSQVEDVMGLIEETRLKLVKECIS